MTRQQPRQLPTPTRPDDELGGVDRLRELDEGLRDVVADKLVEGPSQLVHQSALTSQFTRVWGAQTVLGGDVDGQQFTTTSSSGDTGTATQQGLPLTSTGEGDDHPLAGLPVGVDPVLTAVIGQGVVYLVSNPEQGQLAQGGEVAQSEVVGQGGVDPLCRVHLAAREPIAQGLRGEIDNLHLVGLAQHGVRDGLALRHPGDLFDDVIKRLDVLDVDRRDDIDPGVQQFLDILPALFVTRPGRVGVGQLVDQGDVGIAGEYPVEVHLGQLDAAMYDEVAGDDLQPLSHGRGGCPAVGLDDGDDDVGPTLAQVLALVEHGVGLADARCRAEQHPQSSPSSHLVLLQAMITN